MMRSLFSGVAGLKSHQTRMDVVGNNISNINTVGFKSSRVTFADMLSQTQTGASTPSSTLGGTNPKQIGLGTAVASIDLIFSDGSPQATGKNTDVALSGNGLFVLKSGSQYYYSRDGAFEFDANGNYVLPGSGYYVQGWNAVDGSLNTNTPPTDILVPAGKTMAATATSSVNFTGNLNSGAPVITSITYVQGTGKAENVINGGKITEVKYYDYATDGSVTTATALTSTGYAVMKYDKIKDDGTTVNTEVTVSGSTYTGTTAVSDTYVTSANVDGKNIISAVLTLSDGTTQRVTTGYYQLGHSIPVTTSMSIYDSEGGMHQMTMLLDKKNATKDELEAIDQSSTFVARATNPEQMRAYNEAIAELNNRWVTYIAPAVGERNPAVTYTVTEADGSTTTGYLNRTALTNDEYNALSDIEKADYAVIDSGTTTADGGQYYGRVGYVYFNSDGTLNTAKGSGSSIMLTYSNGNGSADTTSAIDFSGLTQFNGSTTVYPTSNGNSFGVLQSVAIDGAGIITGTYTNGVRRFEAQIAVAQFINAAGLTKIGTSLYQESNNSGSANIKTVTNLGLTITPSALEMSNVDLASELADMIVTQRGFQSNSKMVTVADEMLETVVNMKR